MIFFFCKVLILDWELIFQGMEELWHSLLHKTLELETRVSSSKEEIVKKEDELVHLKDFLRRAIRQRDEAESKCQSIMLDIVTLQQQLQIQKQQKQQLILPHNAITDQPPKETQLVDQADQVHIEPQDVADSASHLQPQLSMPSTELPPAAEKLVAGKPLPEKGKLLQAVMEAGPLLQTLLLAGPLPQWQHPPPRVEADEIPPVAISRPPAQGVFREDYFSCLGRTRSLPPHSEGSVFHSSTKCQKVALY